jgi:hypothetical protein
MSSEGRKLNPERVGKRTPETQSPANQPRELNQQILYQRIYRILSNHFNTCSPEQHSPPACLYPRDDVQ